MQFLNSYIMLSTSIHGPDSTGAASHRAFKREIKRQVIAPHQTSIQGALRMRQGSGNSGMLMWNCHADLMVREGKKIIMSYHIMDILGPSRSFVIDSGKATAAQQFAQGARTKPRQMIPWNPSGQLNHQFVLLLVEDLLNMLPMFSMRDR